MAKVLTEAGLDRLKPDPTKRREIPDAKCPGLYYQLQPSNRRSWAVRTRVGPKSKPIKVTLRSIGLADARQEAEGIVKLARQGIDPRRERERQLAEAARAELETVRAVFEDWMVRDQAKNRSADSVRRLMEADVLPSIGNLPIPAVRRRDIIALTDRIADRAPALACRLLAHTKRMFAWATERDLIDFNPAAAVKKPQSRSRERVFTNGELVAIWRACGEDDYSTIIKLLILTGARRDEVGGMTWPELSEDGTLWRLPADRSKNKRGHEVPLSTQARALLAERHLVNGRSSVFGRGASGFNSWSHAKAKLDVVTGVIGWTVHDIRRTVVTGMAEIGIAPHVIEAVVNHLSGHKGSVAGVYNRAEYRGEKAAALQRWADHVEQLVRGEKAEKSGGAEGGLMQSPPSAPPLRIGIAALLPSEPEHDVGSRPKLQTRDDDALAAVMAVRGIDPTSPNAYRNLALSFACELAAKNGRASPAIEAFRRVRTGTKRRRGPKPIWTPANYALLLRKVDKVIREGSVTSSRRDKQEREALRLLLAYPEARKALPQGWSVSEESLRKGLAAAKSWLRERRASRRQMRKNDYLRILLEAFLPLPDFELGNES